MTRSHSNKTFNVVAALGLAAAGLAGSVQIVSAQQEEDAGTRYARLVADAQIYERYNATIERQMASQQAEIAALEEQLAAIDQTAIDVQPLLQRMFDDLAQFVSNDVPFLKEERSERVERLREMMGRVETSASEKFRRLIEAYQIELEYGRTMDAYRGTLADGREVEFVRLGRVTLLYRTPDGRETGYWDRDQKTWVADNRFRDSISQALRIAKEEQAPDLITVPVPAAQGGRS
jgi:hypothetical protein